LVHTIRGAIGKDGDVVSRSTTRRGLIAPPLRTDGLPPGSVIVELPAPRRRRIVSVLIKLAVFFGVMFVFGLPALAKGREGLRRLADVNPLLLVVGLVLEFAAIMSYSFLTRAALPANTNISVTTLVRIQLATKAVTNVVPGGSAAGSALGYRLITLAGVEGADAGFALATVGLGSAVVLNLLLWVMLLISIPVIGYKPLYVTVGLIGLFVMAGFAVAVVLLMKGHQQAEKVLRSIARRVRWLDEDRVGELVQRLARRLRELLEDRSLLRRIVVWSLLNWLLDAAALWVFLRAFQANVRPDGLIVAFCIANVMAAIPLTPGGIGVVESVLTTVLVFVGVASSVAGLGVNVYRIAQYWLPIPIGAIAYASLRFGRWRVDNEHRLGDLVSETSVVVGSRESKYDWFEQFPRPSHALDQFGAAAGAVSPLLEVPETESAVDDAPESSES
jgi:putative heme transporter